MNVFEGYEQLKAQGKADLGSEAVLQIIKRIYERCSEYLQDKARRHLTSKVPNKEYFSFQKDGRFSRAINSRCFEHDHLKVESFWNAVGDGRLDSLQPSEITRFCYTTAISFCVVIDLERQRDQKTPGTFFEYFIGHLFARRIHVNPRKETEILNLEGGSSLPTDYVFDLGPGKAKYHVPVKTSTRERVIQVWAHQRVLDGVYGLGRFIGILVCLAETKLDKRRQEVVEICLPDQWRAYQSFIAQMKRVYYLDPPAKYLQLNATFPRIPVKPLGEFFFEIDHLPG